MYKPDFKPAVDDEPPSDFPAALLRVSAEPYQYLDERRVHGLLVADPRGYLDYLLAELQAIAVGAATLELPAKLLFTDPSASGDFRVMPCVVRHGQQVRKTVKLVGTNLQQQLIPDQITVGKAFVLHPEENFVSHIVESCLLSSARTGACATLALELLATRRRRVTVLGAGRVGYYAALYAAHVPGIEDIILSDHSLQRAAECTQHLARHCPEVHFQARSRAELTDTDVLILATTSSTPIYGPEDFTAALVISLGADSDTQHELHAHWATHADLFVDTLDSQRYGDLRAWLAAGLVRTADLCDLISALRKPPAAATRPKVFISTGSALFDNLTLGYLLSCLPDQGRQASLSAMTHG